MTQAACPNCTQTDKFKLRSLPWIFGANKVQQQTDVLHGGASTVVRTGPKAYGNTPKSTPTDPKHLHPWKPKCTQFTTFKGTNDRVKFTVIQWTGSHPPGAIRFLLVFGFLSFLFWSFLVFAPSENGSADFDELHIKRCSLMQEVYFGFHG